MGYVLPFESFPIGKTSWCLKINQIHNIISAKVFAGQVSSGVEINGYDFTQVTDLILGTGMSELNAFGDHTFYLQWTINNCRLIFPKLRNIYLFYTTVYFDLEKLSFNGNLKFIRLNDYFLLRSTLTNLSQFTPWCSNSKKAIYLPGDIRNRPHKFQLLYYFYSKNNLEQIEYSLNSPGPYYYNENIFTANHIDMVIDFLNYGLDCNFTLETFKELYQNLSRSFFDDIGYQTSTGNGLNLCLDNYPKEWNNAACNVIAETSFYGLQKHLNRPIVNDPVKFYLSEKTWKPILSGKPFIAFSESDLIYEKLESLGFKTFLNYTSRPEKIKQELPSMYDDNFSIIYRHYFEVCNDRVMSFLSNTEKNKSLIEMDIEHNKENWKKISESLWDTVRSFCPIIKKLSNREFCEMFNQPVDIKMFDQWMLR